MRPRRLTGIEEGVAIRDDGVNYHCPDTGALSPQRRPHSSAGFCVSEHPSSPAGSKWTCLKVGVTSVVESGTRGQPQTSAWTDHCAANMHEPLVMNMGAVHSSNWTCNITTAAILVRSATTAREHSGTVQQPDSASLGIFAFPFRQGTATPYQAHTRNELHRLQPQTSSIQPL